MKKISPKTYGYICLQILLALPFVLFVIAFVYGCCYKDLTILVIVILAFLLYLTLGYIPQQLDFSSIYIKICEDYIYTPNEKVNEKWRTQFEETIYYNDIINIKIISSVNNSQDKKIARLFYGSLKIKKYLEFSLKSGEVKRIWVNYYTRKQMVTLLNFIKTKIDIDVDQIMSGWYDTYRQYKSLETKTNK